MRTWISGVALALMLVMGAQAQQSPAPQPTTEQPPPAAAAPEPKPEPPVVEEKRQPVFDVVEPKAPSVAKQRRGAKSKSAAKPAPRARSAAVQAPPKPLAREDALRAEVLKPNGPCVIKPVMSDQDLVNCGARPR